MSSRKRNKSVRHDQPPENRPPQPRPEPKPIVTAARGKLVLALLIGATLCSLALWQVQAFTKRAAIQRHIAQAGNFARANQAAQAEREFRAAIADDPKNADALRGLADLFFDNNNYSDARDIYVRLVNLEPSVSHNIERLTVCASKLDDSNDALRYAGDTLKLDPNNVTALNVLVDQQLKKGTPEKALDQMRLLVKLQQNDYKVLLKVARSLYLQHLYTESLPILDRIIQLDPGDGKVYFLRGVDRLNAGPSDSDMALVESDFQEFLKLHPGSYLPHRYLGKAYQKMEKWDKAASELEQVAAVHPEMMDVYFDLQTIYQHTGQPAKAAAATVHFKALRKDADRAEHLEKICAVEQGNFDAFMELGELYYKSGNYKRSGSAFLHAGQVRPNDPRPQTEIQKVEAAMTKAAEDARFWQE